MAKTKQSKLPIGERVGNLLDEATAILTEEYSKNAKNATSTILISLELIKLELKKL